jgi:cytochrome b subunit of formate dehydrogenase
MKRNPHKIIEELSKGIAEEISEEEGIPLDEKTIELIKREVKERVLKEIEKKKPPPPPEEEEEYFVRFSLNIRIQHLILAIGVIILIITGLPLKFHDTAWANLFFKIAGGIQTSRIAHRVGAFMLTVVGIYHLLWIIFSKEGRREFYYLLPRIKDFKDFFMNIKYFLGLSDEKPKFDRYSYIEKFDYWAVYWGMVIMIGSGIILTFHNYVLAYLPKYVLDIAREVHSDEALLATLAIVIWHWYNAHFNPEIFPFNPTIFTGKISKERLMREHYLEYERIMKEKEKEEDSG